MLPQSCWSYVYTVPQSVPAALPQPQPETLCMCQLAAQAACISGRGNDVQGARALSLGALLRSLVMHSSAYKCSTCGGIAYDPFFTVMP